MDIKQLCAGTTLLIPVQVEGALFSVGDAHFAQGDGEICGTAIEMQSVFHAQFFLRKGEAARRNQHDVAYFRDTYAQPPELAVPRPSTPRPVCQSKRAASTNPRTRRWPPATQC